MWLPTPDAMVTRMLQAAKTTRDDVVYDLGAGDGRIPIAAAKEFGAKAVGIEYDANLAALARRSAERAGVADKVTIIQGDIFNEDFSGASVVTLYLLPDLNQQLRPRLLRMKPGTRIVSHLWDMGEWEPDDTLHAGESEAFLWIVPAEVAGRWMLSEERSRWEAVVEITQRFQRIGGTLTIRGATQPLLGAYVQGATLGFTFVGSDGGVRSVRARVEGSAFSGSLQFSGHLTPIAGRRAQLARRSIAPERIAQVASARVRLSEARRPPTHAHRATRSNGRVKIAPMRPLARWRIVASSIALALPLAAALPASAQDYPNRPVKVVVPFSPGGAVDGPMRVIAQELSKRLGEQVVVENKPGAGATIGADLVAKAPPDGYTLLLASQTIAISATLYPKLPFDPIEDFAPITLIGREPGVLVVNPALPVKTLQELIAYAKERPGQLDYASSGNGSGQHLFAALLASSTGMKLNHIPYKGSAQATTDLLGGQVMMSIPGTAGMVGHIKAGKLRALAVTGATRSPQLPDVPTVMESGVPGLRGLRVDGPPRARRERRRRSSTRSSAKSSRCSRRPK